MTAIAKTVAHTGQSVRWRRNPADVYTVEGWRDGSLHKDGCRRCRIVNVHGHDIWVPENEIYPYVERSSG